MGFILLAAMNVGITPDKVFPAADGTANAAAGYQHALDSARRCRTPVRRSDLDRRGRPDRRPDRPAPRHRRPVLLRDVVGHGELADDLRVLARRRDPRRELLAPDQPADADPNELDLAGGRRRVHPRPAVPLQPGRVRRGHVDRGHRAVRRLHRARCSCGSAPGSKFQEGPWNARPLEPADRDRRRRSGSCSSRSCSCFRRPSRSRSATFNYTPVVFLVVLGCAGVWWVVSAKNWFKGPKVQGTAEELAAIERDLELAEA